MPFNKLKVAPGQKMLGTTVVECESTRRICHENTWLLCTACKEYLTGIARLTQIVSVFMLEHLPTLSTVFVFMYVTCCKMFRYLICCYEIPHSLKALHLFELVRCMSSLCSSIRHFEHKAD